MSKHTPGPWQQITSDEGRILIADCGDAETLASIPDDYPEAEANARLIVAAPEMLKELCDLAECHNGRCDSCGCEIAPEGYCGCAPLVDVVMNERRSRARRLIAKAGG